MRFLPLLAVILLVGGCGGNDESSAKTATAPVMLCKSATTDLMTPLANKLTLEGAGLSNGQVVKASDRDVYFVAAEIDAQQFPNAGDVAVWATKDPHGAAAIFSVNELAKQYSDWPDASAIDVSPDDVAAAAARGCVFR